MTRTTEWLIKIMLFSAIFTMIVLNVIFWKANSEQPKKEESQSQEVCFRLKMIDEGQTELKLSEGEV